jgi:hypothetical protein
LLLGIAVFAWGGSARGDKPVASADLAVDQVAIKGGPRLLGSVLGREADGTVAFAVGRNWLKATHTRYFEERVAEEAAETRAALTELRDRIADWRKMRGGDKELAFFLAREAERVEKELQAIDAGTHVEDAPFMVVDVAPAKIDRVVNQPPQRRQVALTAWREGLADVETRSMLNLAQELKKRKIDPIDDADALLDLLPPRRQNEAAWSARRAIVEHRFRKPLDFQGTGDAVVRSGEGVKAADVAPLLNDLIKSIAGEPLADLLNPSTAGGPAKSTDNSAPVEKWLATAAKIADSENLDGFRVTRVNQELAARRVAVETRFVARLPDGSWKTVWVHSETADASKPRPDVEQQIEKDPQVRAVLELVKSLGADGDDQIRLAIRFGAATAEAQKKADGRFFEFRDRYLNRLDGPVLRVPPAAPVKSGRK